MKNVSFFIKLKAGLLRVLDTSRFTSGNARDGTAPGAASFARNNLARGSLSALGPLATRMSLYAWSTSC